MSPNFSDHFDLMRQDLSESAWGNAVCKMRECSGRNPNSCPLFPKCWEEGSDFDAPSSPGKKAFPYFKGYLQRAETVLLLSED